MNRHKSTCVQPKIKPCRPGEEPLRSTFPNRNLLQWYKQLRRIQNLVHGCRNGTCTLASWTYQSQCWSSIIRAPGFSPSFRQWWLHRPIRLQSSPAVLLGLPSLTDLEAVFCDFRLNFRHMEAWYMKKQSKLGQARREQSMKDLFKSMKPAGPEPLDFITKTRTFTIVAVDSATDTVQLDAVPDFSLGLWDIAGERILPSGCNAPVVDDFSRAWCSFDSDLLPVPGQVLTQTQAVAVVPDIHQALLDFWTPRWKALAGIPETAWDRIVAFTRAFIPRHQLTCPPLASSDLCQVFRSGAGLKTGGPDGWRKADILALPDAYLTDVVSLFQYVENGACWPTQLTRGHVTCLQKRASQYDVANYRPIVVFSLLYRLWGCLRARHYLAQLEQLADFPAFGFLAGRGCRDITFAIQAVIEVAVVHGLPCCGALYDVEKCFNCLPRGPIMFLARWFGIDAGVVHAWKSFLSQMHRSFVVHHAPSESVVSDHGLPEGDSMSCLGMVLLNFSYHFYFHHFQPNVMELSYVDNLEMLGTLPGEIISGHVTLQTWAEMFRLTVDRRKSSCWALRPEDRDALKSLGLSLVTAGADLGASMIYGKQHRNKVLQDRIQDVKPFWKKLRTLRVSVWHKLLLVRMALLPRALHASNLTFLGDHWFVSLRTQIMRALRVDRAGASPLVRVALIFGLDVDPEFYDGWRTFHDLVFFLQRNAFIRAKWAAYCQLPQGRRSSYLWSFCQISQPSWIAWMDFVGL